jgi:hypothetical protein
MAIKEKNNTETVVLKLNPAQHFAGFMTSAGLLLGRDDTVFNYQKVPFLLPYRRTRR